MVDSVNGTNGSATGGMGVNYDSGMDDNGANSNRATTNRDIVSGITKQTMTTADRLVSSPTTAEKLSSSLTTADLLSGIQTVTKKITNSECLKGEFGISKKIQCNGSLYTNQDKSVQIGHGRFEYTPPNHVVDTEKLKASASVGVDVELTAFDGKLSMPVGEIGSVGARYRVGTVNGHAKAELKAEFNGFDLKKSGASLNASLGGEAMKWDARYSANASITPKSVGDTMSGIYNDYVDPVVDYVAGRDVSEIPPVPDYLGHGIILNGHVTVGEGMSGKIGGNIEIGNGKIFNMSARIKGGLGVVLGAGGTIGLK